MSRLDVTYSIWKQVYTNQSASWAAYQYVVSDNERKIWTGNEDYIFESYVDSNDYPDYSGSLEPALTEVSRSDDAAALLIGLSGRPITGLVAITGSIEATTVGGQSGLTGSLKWEKRVTDLDISRTSYTTFWQKSEPGALFGAVFKLDSEDMEFRVEVDGEEIIDCHLKDDLKDEFKLNAGSGDSNGGNNVASGPPYMNQYNSKHYQFEPPEPIRFSSSIKLQLKSDKNNKDLEAYIVTWKSS